MTVRPEHIKLMSAFVQADEVQANRTNEKFCTNLWNVTCKAAKLPLCSLQEAITAWQRASSAEESELLVGPPNREGMTRVSVKNAAGIAFVDMPSRTLLLKALRAYAQGSTSPERFLSDVKGMTVDEAKAITGKVR